MTRVENLVTLAERMLRDYDIHDPGTAFAEGLDLSIAEAYGVQGHVAHLREARGEWLAGYKIGCVCRGNQRRHGLSHPVYGRLWSTEQYSDDVTLSPDDFANLAIEGEFAVTLRHDIEPGDASISIIASVRIASTRSEFFLIARVRAPCRFASCLMTISLTLSKRPTGAGPV